MPFLIIPLTIEQNENRAGVPGKMVAVVYYKPARIGTEREETGAQYWEPRFPRKGWKMVNQGELSIVSDPFPRSSTLQLSGRKGEKEKKLRIWLWKR